MAQIQTNQVQSFGEALLVIIAYVLIGYLMQRVGYLIPEWYNQSELKHGKVGDTKFMSWFHQQYKQLLIFIPIKYVGNFLYYIVLPLQYFQILSTSLTAYQSIVDDDDSSNTNNSNSFFYQNLIICLTTKLLLLILSALFSMCLFYSTKRKKKSHQQTGILTNEQDVTTYMVKYRQCLLHDHPLAKWCVFGLFATSTYDIAIGIPLIKSIYNTTQYTQYIYLYNLIQLLVIVPFCLLLLDIAVLSVQKKYRKLRQQEMIMKQTMAFQRQELINCNNTKINTNKSMDLTVLTDCDEKTHDKSDEDTHMHDSDIDDEDLYDEPSEPSVPSVPSEQYDNSRQKSAALNVFLSSINKVQVVNQELQEKEEIQRISRLKQLANLPLTTPTGSIGANSLILDDDHDDFNTPYEPTNTFTSINSDNELNESHKNTIEKNIIRHRRKSSTKSSMETGNINSNIKRKAIVSRVSQVSSVINNKKHNGALTVCKRLMSKIILNPIIIASICALICKALVSHSTLISLSVYINKVSSIYEFVGLYIVGSLLAVFFEQRLNIFKFAAANHQNKENKIFLKINENKNKKKIENNNSYNENVFTPNLPEYDREDNSIFISSMRDKLHETETETNIWTYTHNTQTGGIHFTQERMTMTDIETKEKEKEKEKQKQTVKVSSISLMNTDNVMMWWWSLSFVLFRYLISSLSFRFISFALYGYICPVHHKAKEMEVINYLYGTLTPNLLSLIIAMKYNIYISFITISYMISIVLYPIIVFCGLLLFTDVQFAAMKTSVEFVVFTVHICSIIAAFIILIFWYGFKHWRTYPITIFMAILVLDVAYNSSNLLCEYYEYFYENDSNKTYILLIVYFLRQWVRLMLLSAAFQSCLLISSYSVLKRELKTYHCIIQPIIFVLSLIIASLLWFIRYKNKFPFDFTWEYPISEFANTYNVKCQYSSPLQLQIDLIIQSMNTFLLIIMFWYILKKRYQYEIHNRNRNHNRKSSTSRSMLLQMFFCCYLKCCCCGKIHTQTHLSQKKQRKIKKKDGNDKKEPLLAESQTTIINENNNDENSTQLDPNNIVIELRKKSDINHDDVIGYNYNNNNNNQDVKDLPDVLMVDGENVEIQSNYANYRKNISYESESKISIEYVYDARIDCDPNSLETYYQFDYYATTLIILCVALIGFIANVIFIIFLLRSHLNSYMDEDVRILELLMLLSVFQHGQTFFIAILFLSAKPIKRLTKNFWKRLRIFSQNIKFKVDDDDDTFGNDTNHINDDYNDDTFDVNDNKRKLEENTAKTVSLPRQFYHRLPVLW